jgi:hypothetical protein
VNTSLALVIRLLLSSLLSVLVLEDDDLPLLLLECFFLCSSAGLKPFYVFVSKTCKRIERSE